MQGKEYRVCNGTRWELAILTPSTTVTASLLCLDSWKHCQEKAGCSLITHGSYQEFSIRPLAPPFSQPGKKQLILRRHEDSCEVGFNQESGSSQTADWSRRHSRPQSVQQLALVTSTMLSSTPISSEMIRQRQSLYQVGKKSQKNITDLSLEHGCGQQLKRWRGPLSFHLSQCRVLAEGWSYRQQ